MSKSFVVLETIYYDNGEARPNDGIMLKAINTESTVLSSGAAVRVVPTTTASSAITKKSSILLLTPTSLNSLLGVTDLNIINNNNSTISINNNHSAMQRKGAMAAASSSEAVRELMNTVLGNQPSANPTINNINNENDSCSCIQTITSKNHTHNVTDKTDHPNAHCNRNSIMCHNNKTTNTTIHQFNSVLMINSNSATTSAIASNASSASSVSCHQVTNAPATVASAQQVSHPRSNSNVFNVFAHFRKHCFALLVRCCQPSGHQTQSALAPSHMSSTNNATGKNGRTGSESSAILMRVSCLGSEKRGERFAAASVQPEPAGDAEVGVRCAELDRWRRRNGRHRRRRRGRVRRFGGRRPGKVRSGADARSTRPRSTAAPPGQPRRQRFK